MLLQLLRLHGAGEPVALHPAAAQAAKALGLLLRFHALGDDLGVQAAGHPDHGGEDGAGAVVFELAENIPFAVTLGARGGEAIRAGGPAACDTAPITMDGKAVFRFAVEAMPRCLQTVLDRSQKTQADLDWAVCHQANSRIIDHCIKHLHAEPSKFYKNMNRHGNTSAASIPIALHEMEESGLLRPGQTLACIGFGGGLTWGGMLLTYEGRK